MTPPRQAVVERVLAAQHASGGAAAGKVVLPDGSALLLGRFLPLAELRRHKRGFLKAAASAGLGGKMRITAEAVADLFRKHLAAHLDAPD